MNKNDSGVEVMRIGRDIGTTICHRIWLYERLYSRAASIASFGIV